MNRILRFLMILLTFSSFVSCKQGNTKLFTSLSHKRTGINFRNWVKETETFNVLDYAYLYKGAGIAIGDINNDGLTDLFIGGARSNPGRLFIQNNTGSFKLRLQSCFDQDKEYEDIGALLIDADGDKDLDLYVVSGGNEFTKNAPELQDQMPFIEKKYPSYKSYASQKITDIYSPDQLKEALTLKASVFATCYLENNGKAGFTLRPLPIETQLSPVYAIHTGDFNNDNNPDMILAGNFFNSRIQFGDYDANTGLLLTGDGNGGFEVIESGFNIRGEVRDISEVKTGAGKRIYVFAFNNDSVRLYEKNAILRCE